jgi:hypothetical protein
MKKPICSVPNCGADAIAYICEEIKSTPQRNLELSKPQLTAVCTGHAIGHIWEVGGKTLMPVNVNHDHTWLMNLLRGQSI